MTHPSGSQDGFTALATDSMIGRYRIDSVIAAGGFGITYLCRHSKLEKIYALKEHFPRQFAYRDGATSEIRSTDGATFTWSLDRFVQEGRSLAKCAHPGVVLVADVFEANNTAYLVLDYVQGQSFKNWIGTLGRRPTQQDVDAILAPLLEALEYVHSQGMLHRDIAPDNIIIRDNGQPCLIDFGSARQAVAQRSEMMSAIVKLGFSPIEQYAQSGRAQGPWSDIYALSASLYWAISGKMPPEATERQVEDDLIPLAQVVDNPASYRSDFLRAIDHALRIKPAERPQSVAEWRRLLWTQTLGSLSSAAITTPLAVGVPDAKTMPQLDESSAVTRAMTSDPAPQVAAPPRRSSSMLWLGAGVLAVAVGVGAASYSGQLQQVFRSFSDARRPASAAVDQPGKPAPINGAVFQAKAPEVKSSSVPTIANPVPANSTAATVPKAANGDATRQAVPANAPSASDKASPAKTELAAVPINDAGKTAAAANQTVGASPPRPASRTIEEMLSSVPEFSPIDGLDASIWKQPCSSCHKWTPALICEQGQTYVKDPTKITRHPHPFGGVLKTMLKEWAERGCK